MSLQWQFVSVPLDQEKLVSTWLARGYEPFGVGADPTEGNKVCIFLKKEAWVEDDEPRSSTKPENAVAQ